MNGIKIEYFDYSLVQHNMIACSNVINAMLLALVPNCYQTINFDTFEVIRNAAPTMDILT